MLFEIPGRTPVRNPRGIPLGTQVEILARTLAESQQECLEDPQYEFPKSFQ